MPAAADRKQRGAWYTPADLVDSVVDAAVTGGVVRIVDPACGDGRFLLAAAQRVRELGGTPHAVGVDIDQDAVAAARESLGAHAIASSLIHGDALTMDWSGEIPFDLVIGNPPYLSQMASATTRGGASSRGGGPYADAAVEFLALAAELVQPVGGRVAFVLPQSVLSARDAAPVRAEFAKRAALTWSWWTGERVFDAQVLTCALVFEFGTTDADTGDWSSVITGRSGVPPLPASLDERSAGTLGDRCRLNANFRDEYYGMIPAVGDHATGPKLVTSGLIDPGVSWWGARDITFAKRRFSHPRIDLAALEGKMPRWAADRLVPKVLIANQTKILEAVVDADGSMLPGVPVVAAYPVGSTSGRGSGELGAWEIGAVLTSPLASAWAWHQSAGTGLSADAIRVGPVMLAELPWPAGPLDEAVRALQSGDVRACAAAVHSAYGLEEAAAMGAWWLRALERIESRQPTNVTR